MTDVAIATTRHGWENRLNRQPMDRVGDSLVFAETYERPGRPGVFGSVVSYIVDKIYLGHNRTPAVKRTLRKLAEDFERTG